MQRTASVESEVQLKSSLRTPTTTHDPINITFRNIKYTVQLRGQAAAKSGESRKEILCGISGACPSGRVTSIMGSSGAGKSTLLDILACNTMTGKAEGQVLVNGAPRSKAAFNRIACYVLQQDVLLSSATVRESITLSAMLKLPGNMSKAEKLARVDKVLTELDLVECADTLIGDETMNMKGISGGQKRRVSIGMELVKEPNCIFLDEPTSGLDSEMAQSLMDCLVRLARSGKTVVLSIHQPNSFITASFDNFMLLAQGKLIYGGRWKDAVPFFASYGYVCPATFNPTDYFLALMKDGEAVEKLLEGQKKIDTVAAMEGFNDGIETNGGDIENLENGANGEQEAAVLTSYTTATAATAETTTKTAGTITPLSTTTTPSKKQRATRSFGRTTTLDTNELASLSIAAPWYQQVTILFKRNLLMYLRNPAMFIAEIVQYAGMGLFVGLMYLQLTKNVSSGVNDRIASLWFAMAVLSFTPSYTAVTVWDRERVLLRREVTQHMYTIPNWFMAKTLVVWPSQLLQTLFFALVAYFMVGYHYNIINFLVYVAIYFMFQITSESIGVLCAATTKNSTASILVLTFVLLILLSFSGFLVTDVPVYFQWVTYISYLTYAFCAAVQNEFDSTTFYNDAGEQIPGSTLIPPSVDTGLSMGVNMVILACITVGTRVLAFVAIWGAHRIKFL